MKQQVHTPTAPYFISNAEYREFQKPNRFVPRTLIETPIEGSGRTNPREVKLDFQLRTQLLEASKPNSFTCSYIGLSKNDGMSWSAEKINAEVIRTIATFRSWYPKKAVVGTLPGIAGLIGEDEFCKLAARHKLTSAPEPSFTSRWLTTPVVIVLSILVGATIEVLAVIQKSRFSGTNQTLWQLFTDWKFYALMFATGAMGVLSKTLITRATTKPTAKLGDNLALELPARLNADKARASDFVDSLAQRIRTNYFPRVAILENYEKLDQLTKEVIECYFSAHAQRHTGAETWFILETANREEVGLSFRTDALSNSRAFAYAKTNFFEQISLDSLEKKELVRLLGRPEDAAKNISVKAVCHDLPDDEEIKEYFLYFHQEHGMTKTYDTLRFLALLSLTADNIPLSRNLIVKKLPGDGTQRPVRGDVLAAYFDGKAPSLGFVRTQWTACIKTFKGMLIGDDEDFTKLQVISEKTYLLEKLAAKLELPDPGMGHLFWGLFWYDKLQSDGLEPVLVQKLAAHLLKAEPTTIEEEKTYERILQNLFQAMLFAVDGCMKVCLFRSVPKLLQAALKLLRGDLPQDDYQKHLNDVLRKSWEAYSILGDERILRLILAETTTPTRAEVKAADEMNHLERLYFDTVSLDQEQRKKLRTDVLVRTYGQTKTREAVSDYAQARAAWLTLTSGSNVRSDVNHFLTCLSQTDITLPEIAKRSFSRIQNISEESVRLTDVITLSLALWCNGLRFNPSNIEAKHQALLLDAAGPGENALSLNPLTRILDTVKDFSSLIALAEDSVLLASEITRESNDDSASSFDYVLNALAKELCAMSIGSVLMANSYYPGGIATDDQLKQINNLIRISNDFLESALPEVETLEELADQDLIRQVNSIMKLCGIIWNEFGLYSLRDLMNIRQIHFSAQCLGMTAESLQNSIAHSLGQVISPEGFSGIMTNLVASEALRSAEVLSAYYLIHAAEISLDEHYGRQLKNELCLAAVLGSHAHKYDLDIFLEYLTTEGPDRRTLLDRFLTSLSYDLLEGQTLRLLNAWKKTTKPGDRDRAIEILSSFAQTITNEDVRKKVQSMIAFRSTEEKIEKGDLIDLQELLKEWADKKESWLYPWLLELLIQNGRFSNELETEALSVLDKRNPSRDTFNTYFLLSFQLVLQFHSDESVDGRRRVSVNYLKEGIGQWESHLSPEINVRISQLLYRFDLENRSEHEARMLKWQVIKLEADQLKLLPRLLSNQSYFLVFQYYFESLAFFGLDTEMPVNELNTQLNIDSKQMTDRLREWKESGEQIPPVLTKDRGRSVISSRFLILGSYLFSPPNDQSPLFAEERRLFDESARVRMVDFVSLIIALPSLPVSIKDLIRNFSSRLISHKLPGE